MTEQTAALIKDGITNFFSGMADGTGHYCAQIVLTLRERSPALKLHCVLPREGQADKWGESARERYHFILKQADSIEYVSRAYYGGCMIDRNHRLAEAADLLLTVYNGVRRSGTGATVNYARKMGREIIVIDPITRLISREEAVPSPAQS